MKALMPLSRILKLRMKRIFVKCNIHGHKEQNVQNRVVGDERGEITVTTEKVWF